MYRLVHLYKLPVRAITVPLLERCLRFLDSKSWVPVFYFFLARQTIVGISLLHSLNNVQVKTGRRVIVISVWPFWPWDTAKDQSFVSFIRGLNPKIRYIWIPYWLQRVAKSLGIRIMRLLQIHGVLYTPLALGATIRFDTPSTTDNADILNHGARVVLQIPKPHQIPLEERAKALGISPDDWFVCVHARESGFIWDLHYYGLKPPSEVEGPWPEEKNRNMNIEDCFPAMKHVLSAGGLIVRMGDSSMKRLPPIDGFIDYPFTEHKSITMDLYLLSRCKFLLGSESGFASHFAASFGAPVLMTNLVCPLRSANMAYSSSLVMPKLVQHVKTGRILGPSDMFDLRTWIVDSVVAVANLDAAYSDDGMGFQLLSNSPDEILEATKEMLQLVETDSFDRPMTKEQELFHQLRLATMQDLSSEATWKGNHWSVLRSVESRISATYAAKHFQERAD